MYILGISCYYHDSAAALLSDGLLVSAAEEERFSRIKHDHSFPKNAINFCLDYAGITSKELDYVVFYEKPLIKFERILMTSLELYPRTWRVFPEAMITWFNEKLWIRGKITDYLDISREKILFTDHHLSHAASAFLCSPFEEAAILTVDGVGEWTTSAMGKGSFSSGHNGKPIVQLDQEIRFPHSLGLIYSAFTALLGFQVNEGEYKVMGMAPYGQPRYVDDVKKVIHYENDGSFRLNMDYFSFTHSLDRTYSEKFVNLFGNPRKSDSEFYTIGTHPKRDHPDWNDNNMLENQKFADIAASIQFVTEEIILNMAREVHRKTGLRKLCMAGGVALNSVANGRIVNETPFDEVFIQPAAGDAGGALGAALYVYHVLLGNPKNFVFEHAYWGAEYSSREIEDFLKKNGHKYEFFDDKSRLVERVVDTILDQKVVGLYQGRFEWGPRALGNRSILADPRRPEMKNIVNTKIKFREPFRPFAPAILENYAHEYFEIKAPANLYPARFMLLVQKFKDGKGEEVSAVNHFGTGRLQTVSRETNPFYYEIINQFHQATGTPIILNTSFNLRGEPIVNTPANAFWTYSHSEIDMLILGNYLLEKER